MVTPVKAIRVGPMSPDDGLKISPYFPNNTQNGATTVLLKSDAFHSSLENWKTYFKQLLLEKMLTRTLKNRSIWSHCWGLKNIYL